MNDALDNLLAFFQVCAIATLVWGVCWFLG